MKKIKATLSLCLACAVILSTIASIEAFAADTLTDPGGITYKVVDGSVIITGYDHTKEIVEIPAEINGYPVSGYESRAFWTKAYKVKEFVVEESNEYFCADEFGVLFDKDKTKVIKYPAASEMTEYVVPDTVTIVGYCAFNHCDNLRTVVLGNSVSEISQEAFYMCDNLESINFPEGLERISKEAFSSCEKLSNADLPMSLTEIGQRAFTNTAIKSFYISKNVKTIYEAGQALLSKALVSIEVSEENLYFSSDDNGVLYNKDKTTLLKYPDCLENEKFVVPDGVKSIGVYALSSDYLKEVILPESVLSFYSDAFTGCGINRIEIPAGVKSISDSAFLYCDNLKEVFLPVSVQTIKYGAFRSCEAITDVFYSGTQEEWEAITFANENDCLLNATIHYNYGKSSGNCGETLTWSFDEDSKVLSITGSGEMNNLASFEEYGWAYFKDQIEVVEFGNAAVSVGSNAFYGCPNLKEVYLSESIGTIGANAFADCPLLSLVTVSGAGFTADETSFSGNDERLVFLCNPANTQATNYAKEKLIKSITFSYDHTKKVMNFNGELTVYSDLPYTFLSKFVKQNPGMEYLYFEKLVFHGVEPEMIDINDLNNEASAQYLTFNKLYVSLKKVKGGSTEDVTFDAFLTLLENGDYDSFMFELVSQEGKQQLTFEELWEKVTDHFITSALRITSKIINFFRKIFR